jgi:hypothetical protein
MNDENVSKAAVVLPVGRSKTKLGAKRTGWLWLLAMGAGLLMAGSPAGAQNLLVNPGFELPPSGHNTVTNPATGWTYFSPPPPPGYFGDFWVDTAHGAHSGTFYWKEWGALYLTAPTNNVAGIYQTFSSTGGSTYQASGWMYTYSGDTLGADCYAWIQVEFLGSASNLLALYKSDNFSANAGVSTWIQYPVVNACDLTQPVATGDPYFTTYAETGTVSQLVAPPGTTAVRFRYCLLQAGSEGGSAYLDDTVLNQVSGPVPPVISGLYPQNMIFVPPSSGLTFDVSSPSGFAINNSAIHLALNGVDVSSSLAISGTSSNKTVQYSGLQSNAVYAVSITATDTFNLSVNANTYFETTWHGVSPATYVWEAEDWDFSSGEYIDNPELCNACCDANCYFGQVGAQGVDENNINVGPNHFYRANDNEGTAPSGDFSRPNLFAADRIDYCINPFNYSEWVNYTRDWPSSTNWIVARLATDIGLSGSITLSVVNAGLSTNNVGTFSINGGHGWSAFEYVYLLDTNGNRANVVLNGKETLRTTSGGNLLPTFYMLVPAQVDLPLLSNLEPTGTHPFEYTNALSFTVTTAGATFASNSIKVVLDGNDISPNLQISGSSSSNEVIYPTLQPNAIHVAIITVTNSLGHGISVTNSFDTFSQSNYTFEAEDFDYSGGQYIPDSDWYPDAYAGYTSVSNVDFQHTLNSGEPTDGSDYQYRLNGIPQQPAFDYLRQDFIDYGAIDYQLYWFGATDWVNYTRDFAPGSYFVYARSAGLGAYTMTLDEVVSGAGTTNQTTRHLGQWSAVGISISTNAWVPLTDAGLVAPVVVHLGGESTLRLSTTTGDCYPNFFMLVSASGVKVSAARLAKSVNVYFPTQAGATYRVFYRTSLLTGNWLLLGSALGNGSLQSITDTGATDSQRFYEVTSP